MAVNTAISESGMRPAHPLEALAAAEIETAAAILREDERVTDAARFAYFGLEEPPKDVVATFDAGDPVERRVRVVIVPGPAVDVIEAVVDVNRRAVQSWREVAGVRPGLLFEEAINAIAALNEHPEWQAALARRGITDVSHGRPGASGSRSRRDGASPAGFPFTARRTATTATRVRSRA
jgi:primary-amine oxidase